MVSKDLPISPDRWSNLIKYSEIGEEAFRQAENGRRFDFNSIENPYSMIIEALETEQEIHILDETNHSTETLYDYINYLSDQGPYTENLLGLNGFKTQENSLMEKLEEMEELYDKITEIDKKKLQDIKLESSYLNDFFNSVEGRF